MDDGETISSIVSITQATRNGEDTSDLTLSNQSINDQKAEVWIEGGVICTTYRLDCKILTSTGQKLELDGLLRVEDK